MPSPKPIISIVTPTFNRLDELAYLIGSIKDQTLKPKYFEMIISDDGSSDGTKSQVQKWQEEVLFKLVYVCQNNLGPGAARNKGAKYAQGELIVFIDSDCEANINWLKNIHGSFLKNEFDAFGGPDDAKDDFLPVQRAINFSLTSFLTTGGIRGHNNNMGAKFYPRSHNMGVKKLLFDKIGGFGSLRHGQDIELSNRIIKQKAVVKLLENVIVYHRRRTTLSKFFRQVFNWGVARINLGKIDKKMLQFVHFLPSIATLGVLSIILGSFIFPKYFMPLFFIGCGILSILCFYGGIKSKSALVAAYLFAVIPFQVFGYGSGFIIAFVKRYILGYKVFTGFRKKYY